MNLIPVPIKIPESRQTDINTLPPVSGSPAPRICLPVFKSRHDSRGVTPASLY